MAKSDSLELRIIPHSERTPELEDKVKYWMGITYDLPRNEKRIQRSKDPDSRDPLEIKTFRREEIRRIKNGAFGMCGKTYFWYNYVKMTDVEKGLIRPTFMVAQNEWFKQIEEVQKSKRYGLICVKRRRIGASWMEAADVLHDAITSPNMKFGMTSKSADDSVALFEKVKFIYDNLPDWLRPATTAGRSRTRMDFSYYEKDSKGSLVKKGTQSEIIVKPPTDIAWEGFALSKLVIDECFGKDTDILMFDGTTKQVQNVVVGDLVMGDDFTKRTVTKISTGVDQLYTITPAKGDPWVCNSKHLLTLKSEYLNSYIDIVAEEYFNIKNKPDLSLFTNDELIDFVITKSEIGNYYGFTLDESPYFLLTNQVVVRNCGKISNLRQLYSYAEPTLKKGFIRVGVPVVFGCVCAGTKVWTADGSLINIEDLTPEMGILGYKQGEGVSVETIPWFQPPAEKECVRITTSGGRTLECSTDHPILWSKRHLKTTRELPKVDGKRKRDRIKITKWVEALNVKVGGQVAIIEEVPIFGSKKMWEPRLVGWLIGDGTYGIDSTPCLSNCEDEINEYIYGKLDVRTQTEYITKSTSQVYRESRIKGICPKLRELGIYGQTKSKKTLPAYIHSYSKEDICELLGGLFDTDGYVINGKSNKNVSLTSAYFNFLMEVKFLLQKIGVHGGIHRVKMNPNNPRDRNDHFRLTISDRNSILKFKENITFFVKRKQKNLEDISVILEKRGRKYANNDEFIKGLRFEIVQSVENIGKKPIYNLTAGVTNTYIANGIVTHNTAGDIGKEGAELMNMWYNADAYEFKQFFFGGWMGVMVDEYGNDMREEVIRAIVYERKRREALSSKEYNDFIQQYPLTAAEAFASNAEVGLGNKIKISKQREWLLNNPIFSKKGDFRPDTNGKPKFIPNPNGRSTIFEEPQESIRDLYLAGSDPVDTVTEGTKKASAHSMFIMKKASGTDAPKIVFEYTYRPEDPRDAYEQCYLALLYYNKCKVLIEKNRPGMINYFEEQGYKYLMATKPVTLKSLVARTSYDIGFHKDKYIQAYQEEIISEYIEDHYTLIPSLELLDEFNKYGMHNTDRVNAFGACLMLLKEDKTKAKSITEGRTRIPNFSYKMRNGKLMYVKA